jgi:hypothetical protein
MSEERIERARRVREFSIVRVLLGVLVVAIPLAVLLGPFSGSDHGPYWRRIKCLANLRGVSVYFALYAADHNDVYPTPEKWCDLLVDMAREDLGDPNGLELLHRTLRCPSPRAPEGRCHFAMNPHADPCSAPDTVLLFESKPGWNQYGGRELLTLDNHDGEGCSVLFVDYSISFVQAQEVASLKWGQTDGSR